MTRKMPPGRKKGSKKTGGRQKGTPNKVTREAREIANALVDDPRYIRKLSRDFRTRKVNPVIESMLWYYAKGKPREGLDVTNKVDMPGLTARMEKAAKQMSMQELEELRDATAKFLDIYKRAGIQIEQP
jgi:hypothetical protein